MPRSITNRINTFLLVLLLLMAATIIAILARRAGAGPLDPPGAPASTMHTLDDVYNVAENAPQAWDQKFDSTNGSTGTAVVPAGCNSDRFACVFRRITGVLTATYDGVLDRETGLVWQRSPDTALVSRQGAEAACGNVTTADRGGWRLPTRAELGSLQTANGSLPAGNPFINITAPRYWTSTWTEDPSLTADGFSVGFPGNGFESGTTALGYWCVRGATSDR